MLKKFVKSKVFVLSMLVASVAGNARGMNQSFFGPYDENYSTFGNNSYSHWWSYEQGVEDYGNIFLNQGNDGQLQDTNAAPANQPTVTANEEEFAWCTEEEFNKWCNENVFQINENAAPRMFLLPQINPMAATNVFQINTNAATQASTALDQGNDEQLQGTSYPPNWYISGAGQVLDNYEAIHKADYPYPLRHLCTQTKEVARKYGVHVPDINIKAKAIEMRRWFADNWDNIKDYVNEAIQTNPPTHRGRQQLYSDGWEGSDTQKFCIIHGLTTKDEIRHFVAKMRALHYPVPPIPNDPVDGRRVFMNDVYPILANLPGEEVQRIKNYDEEPEMTVPDEAAIIERWKESKIRRYVKDANLTKRELISLNNHFSTVIPGFPRVNRNAWRKNVFLFWPLLQFEPEILSFMKFETFLQFKQPSKNQK